MSRATNYRVVLIVSLGVGLTLAILMTRMLLFSVPRASVREVTEADKKTFQELAHWAPAPGSERAIRQEDLLQPDVAAGFDQSEVSFTVVPYVATTAPASGTLLLLGSPARPLPAYFLGDVSFRGRGPVRVQGVYNHQLGGVFVHQIDPVAPPGCPEDPEVAHKTSVLLIAVGVVLMLVSLGMIRGRALVVALTLGGGVLGTGCEIQLATILNNDHTVTLETRLIATAEEAASLDGLPNFSGFLDAWEQALKSKGYEAEHKRDKSGLEFRLRRAPIPANQVPPRLGSGSSWYCIRSEHRTGYSVFRILVRVSTHDIMASADGATGNAMIQDKLRTQLGLIRFSYAATLPRAATFHNALRLEEGGNRAVWPVPMGEDQLLCIESVERSSDATILFQVGLTVALMGLIAALTSLIFATLRRIGAGP